MDGRVRLAFQLDGLGEQPFESVPKIDAVEHGIQKIRGRAIMAVLRIGMMARVMFRGLQ